jgi:hypothetical protein
MPSVFLTGLALTPELSHVGPVKVNRESGTECAIGRWLQ